MASKSVLCKVGGVFERGPLPRKERQPMYGRPVLVALETLWEIFNRPCGLWLKPLLEELLRRLRALGELEIDAKTAR